MKMEREEFNEFVIAIYDPLLRFAWWLCGDHHLAKDLIQDTCIKMWRINTERGGNVEWTVAYAKKILSTIYLDHCRKVARANNTVVKIARMTLPEIHEDNLDEQDADRSKILQVLQELPERHKEAYFLSEVGGFKPAEIADLMGLKPATVSNYLLIARKIVKKAVADLANRR